MQIHGTKARVALLSADATRPTSKNEMTRSLCLKIREGTLEKPEKLTCQRTACSKSMFAYRPILKQRGNASLPLGDGRPCSGDDIQNQSILSSINTSN